MSPTAPQMRTLRLLAQEPALRRHHSPDKGDYTWTHRGTDKPITQNLHSCFIQGWADVDKDRDIAVITDKGRAVVSSYLEV
jgi:hypothetical protein